jgi:hypothetical protein
MTEKQQRDAARAFASYWGEHGDEKQDTQRFWMDLLQNVLGVENPSQFIEFEVPVMLSHTSFIDGFIPSTRVLIEQKSEDIDLKKGSRQSDGSMLTPFQQARRYAGYLPHNQNPRWIVVCNFREFQIHDMNRPNDEPELLKLEELETQFHRLHFLVDTGDTSIKKEMEISLQAGDIVGVLYDALLEKYKDPTDPETLKSLNALCVRLVFCLYAEDAGIFGARGMFHDYLKRHVTDARRALIDLFKVLDTKEEDRDPYMDEDLAAFPYVNGGLFADESVVIPRLDESIVDLILHKASEDFDWSEISPTIFGAVFESTLNPETRRAGGMHYTSIENIHKVIDPLFLDGLKQEFSEIAAIGEIKARNRKLRAFQSKLAGLKFLDPACGSGNFLTETYLSLRRLENDILRQLTDQVVFGGVQKEDLIQVSIGQFYGIEINDFAVTVARTALWIAESQMMKETEDVVHMSLDFLPLRSYANITEGNALRLDWESVVPKHQLSYIMGNPPFVGYSLQSKEQKKDILSIYVNEKGKPYKTAGKIDYVAGWYFKASQLIQGTNIRIAFVSTNSITQGEQVAGVWKPLYDRFGIHIDFAYRTFRWDSEANLKAHVHCVIVGFSVAPNNAEKRIYSEEHFQMAENINAYLMDAPTVFIESRSKSLCEVPEMLYGNKPTDGGFLFLTNDEYQDVQKREPEILKYIRRVYGASEFINNKPRFCIWLVGVSPAEVRKSKFIMERVESVRKFRLASTKAATRKSAEMPTLFQEVRHPNSDYIIVPRHSSETRKYIPLGFVSPEIIVNDAVQIIPNATTYHFGVLTSNVHMAWMRAVCGRIKSDYRYSKDIVYNNFPWPTPTEEQKTKIEQTAQGILDARALYTDCSLADLYDEVTMPVELRRAHQANDKAVMAAYGFPVRTTTEASCVAELMRMYQRLVEGK